MTPNLFDFMQTYDVRHDGDNMSDHSVIYTALNLDMNNIPHVQVIPGQLMRL